MRKKPWCRINGRFCYLDQVRNIIIWSDCGLITIGGWLCDRDSVATLRVVAILHVWCRHGVKVIYRIYRSEFVTLWPVKYRSDVPNSHQ